MVEKYNLSSLRIMASGAAPLPASHVHTVQARFVRRWGTRPVIVNGYGMTETSPGSHFLSAHASESKLGSVGTLFPNLQARLVDADGNDVRRGETGELWLRYGTDH